MNPRRGGVAALAGALTGALASGISAVGEWQTGLAAGGLTGVPGTSAVAVAAPAWATGAAILTAAAVGILGFGCLAVLTRASATVPERRLYWAGALVVTVVALTLGSIVSAAAIATHDDTASTAVVAAAGHSPLVAFEALVAAAMLITTLRPDPGRGRLVG